VVWLCSDAAVFVTGHTRTIRRVDAVEHRSDSGALVPVDFAERQLDKVVQQGVHMFRTDFLCQCDRVLEVTKKNGDLFTFAFKGTSSS
jgi:hypothetical protein